MSLRPHIRWMIRRDLPFVLKIEEKSFGNPWTEEDFLNVLRKSNCIAMVAEVGEDVVGYIVYELHKKHIYVYNIAVDPAHRRQGIGACMVEKLIGKLSEGGRTKIKLEAGERNLGGHLFFAKQGFKATGVARNFYEDKDAEMYGEDAYSFVYKLRTPVSSEL